VINVALRPKSPVKFLPLGIAYIATAIKNKGYHFDLLDIDAYRYSDEYIESFFSKNKYDVVLMGCIVTGYQIIKDLAALIRRYNPKATIIVGNSVADSIPKILLSKTEADIAVLGEGDITVVELLDCLKIGRSVEHVQGIVYKQDSQIICTDPRPVIKDLSTIPIIDYSIWDFEKYVDGFRAGLHEPFPLPPQQIRGIVVNTARGCVNRCTFCYHVFRKSSYRHRPWKHIFEEIRELVEKYGINYIGFNDELTFSTKKSVREFLDAFNQAGIRFFWYGDCRGNLFADEEDLEILKALKETGCTGIGYSLESSDPAILKSMNKHMTVEEFSYQTNLFHKAGITVWTSLVFGYPQETPDTIRATIDCCIQNRIYPSAGYLLPFPGSEMYQYALDHGFIDKENEEEYLLMLGDRQDLRLNMTQMSDEEFESTVKRGLDRCNKSLRIGLIENELTKTQYYRVEKSQ